MLGWIGCTSNASLGWLALKQEFAGFTVTEYDRKTDVLTLAKDGTKIELRLNAPKVQSARLEVRGSMTLLAGEKEREHERPLEPPDDQPGREPQCNEPAPAQDIEQALDRQPSAGAVEAVSDIA